MAGLSVLVLDDTDRLTPLWRLGSSVSRADIVIRASTWADAYDALAEIDAPVDLLSVWGHGNDGRAYIAGRTVDLVQLGQALRTAHPRTELWWRSCETHRGERGRQFAADVTRITGCVSVGHCVVVAWPSPLWQGAICALRPGETPWWPSDGRGLPGCSTLRMRVPPWAYTGAR